MHCALPRLAAGFLLFGRGGRKRCGSHSPFPTRVHACDKENKNPSSRNDTRYLFASGTHVMQPAAAPHAAAVLRPAAAPHAAAVLLIDEGPQVLQHRVHTRGADFASFQVRQSLFLAECGSLLAHRTLWSMPHSSHAVSLWPTLTRPTCAMTCTPRNCPNAHTRLYALRNIPGKRKRRATLRAKNYEQPCIVQSWGGGSITTDRHRPSA